MKLEIVNKEIATQLKELGFDWITNQAYEIDDDEPFNETMDVSWNSPESGGDYIAAPEQALVCKWFRDTKQIEIHIFKSDIGWCFQLEDSVEVDNNNEPFTLCNSYAGYKNYEQAEEAGIFKAIEILKK